MSRVWRRVKADWEAWNGRSLAQEPIVRLILDGTVVRVRLDRKATSAHAPERLHDEITTDYTDMIYAATPEEIETRRKVIRKWRLRHRPVADCLEEAGDRLLTFTRLPPSQWRSARTTNAIERLHEEFKRRIKTQTVLPSGRYCCDFVLGAARLGADQHAESRWLANARNKPPRSTD